MFFWFDFLVVVCFDVVGNENDKHRLRKMGKKCVSLIFFCSMVGCGGRSVRMVDGTAHEWIEDCD